MCPATPSSIVTSQAGADSLVQKRPASPENGRDCRRRSQILQPLALAPIARWEWLDISQAPGYTVTLTLACTTLVTLFKWQGSGDIAPTYR